MQAESAWYPINLVVSDADLHAVFHRHTCGDLFVAYLPPTGCAIEGKGTPTPVEYPTEDDFAPHAAPATNTAPAYAPVPSTSYGGEPYVVSPYGDSHIVHGYCRRNGTYVRPHMSGNPYSGEHWHLTPEGMDIRLRA